MQRSRERGLYTVVDSTPSVLRAVLKGRPSLVTPNQHEAESVVGFDFIEEGDFIRSLSRLVELGALGVHHVARRALVPDLRRRHRFGSRAQVETISTIGSGDAYLAGLLAGLLHRNLAPVDAVRLAAGCAAANAETLGAGLFEARRAEELAESVQIDLLSRSFEESRA